MNKLFLLLVFFPFLSFAQFDDIDPLYSSDGFTENLKTKIFTFKEMGIENPRNEIDMQFDFIRYCNYRYQKQHKTSYVLSGLSVGLAVIGVQNIRNGNEGTGQMVIGSCGAMSLAALVVYINAEKWMKYSSFKPSDTGIGVKILF